MSWLSFAFYFFVGDTIRDAAHVKHLSLDRLPPIADFDDAENLMKQSLHVCCACFTGDPQTDCHDRSLIPSKQRRGGI